jgi:spore photoproduct lyase
VRLAGWWRGAVVDQDGTYEVFVQYPGGVSGAAASAPFKVDDAAWVYDIEENSDCSVDALVSDNVRDLVELFRGLPTAKASFATKHVNRDLLDWDPQGRTRVRFSHMPERAAKLLDLRTSPIAERLAALDDFRAASYEVHVNLSPVVVHDGWQDDWRELLEALGDAVSPATRDQLAAEVIMLTHNTALHEANRHPVRRTCCGAPTCGRTNAAREWRQRPLPARP